MRPQLSTATGLRPSALGLLATLAVGLAVYCYFAGEGLTLPIRLVPHLASVPLTLEQVRAGAAVLPVHVSGFVTTLTHDVGGPFTQGWAAGVFLGLLALAVAGWTAVVSTLARIPFAVGMAPVIFLLMSLNADALSVFPNSEQGFLYLSLALVGGVAFGLHAFAENLALGWRWLIMGALVAGLGGFLFVKSQYSALETTLQLAAYATTAGAVLVALVVLWVSVENVRALLWFNTQADDPASRFGPTPFLVGSLCYLGALFALVWNDELRLWPGLGLDPLVLLLPASLAAGLGLRGRAPSYQDWVPYSAARHLYPLVLAAAAGALAYAFGTANTPLLWAVRDFTAQALLLLGGAFLLYVLMNYLPLLRQRLRVYRVVFEPKRLPFYVVYLVGVGGLIAVQLRNGNPLPLLVQAGEYNHLGDLTRLQSENQPDDFALGVLAERYYAESGDVLARNNAHAQLGRAALYRFRAQLQNEVIALRRGLMRDPSERLALRLASLYSEPADLFSGLDVLRRGLRAHPHSAALAGDLAQLFTRTSVADSVVYYLDRAEQLAAGNYPSRTNRLGFLLMQQMYPAATKVAGAPASPQQPALAGNQALLHLLQGTAAPTPTAQDFAAFTDLDAADFAAVYHTALAAAQRHSGALLPTLARLNARPANAGYYEQLLFLQALTQHAVGQELAARQLLAPLAAGTSATTAYFRELRAIWQVQQGQYRTAAEQLARSPQADSAIVAQLQALALASPVPAQPPVGTAWLMQARQVEKTNAQAARRLYRRVVREAPFNEAAVQAAAAFYTRQGDYPAAYEALYTGLSENPSSPALLQAYVLAAADAGYPDYALDALDSLRGLLPAADFTRLQTSYNARRAAHAAAAASFQ